MSYQDLQYRINEKAATIALNQTSASTSGGLFEARRRHGLKAYLQIRDGPFQPEPVGPRSKPRD
jgi:hypothetical protein